jgi:hypothetical protein
MPRLRFIRPQPLLAIPDEGLAQKKERNRAGK